MQVDDSPLLRATTSPSPPGLATTVLTSERLRSSSLTNSLSTTATSTILIRVGIIFWFHEWMTVNLSNALTDKSAAVRWMKFTCMLPSLALDTRVKTGQTESDGTRTHIDLPSSFRPVNHFATFSIPRLSDKKYPSVILWFCCVCVCVRVSVCGSARARAHTRVSFLFILPSFCCCSEITVRCGRDVKIQNLTRSFVVVVFFLSPLRLLWF